MAESSKEWSQQGTLNELFAEYEETPLPTVERGRGGKILNVHEVIEASREYLEEKREERGVEQLGWDEVDDLLNISHAAYHQGRILLEAHENGDEIATEEWMATEEDNKALSNAFNDYRERVAEREAEEDTQYLVDLDGKPASSAEQREEQVAIVDRILGKIGLQRI